MNVRCAIKSSVAVHGKMNDCYSEAFWTVVYQLKTFRDSALINSWAFQPQISQCRHIGTVDDKELKVLKWDDPVTVRHMYSVK
jgi:hypothetical protein